MAPSKRGKGKQDKGTVPKGKTSTCTTSKGKHVFAPPILQPQHSFELMGIVSTAVISRIAFARNIFPGVMYELRTYDPADPDPSYASFISGCTGNGNFQATDNLFVWKLLPRGMHGAADRLLDWIEKGVSEAVEFGYLAKFQLAIHSADGRAVCESNLIESYTLTFTYGPDSQMQISTQTGNSEAGAPSTLLFTAKKRLYNLVNDVENELRISHRAQPPPLPSKCRLNMMLMYNENCPVGYQPPLFKPGNDDTARMLNTGVIDARLTMNTDFHSVSVGWSLPAATAGRSQVQVPEFNGASASQGVDSALGRRSSIADAGDTQQDAMRDFRNMGSFRVPHGASQDTQPLHDCPAAFAQVSAFASASGAQQLDGLLPYLDNVNVLVRQAREQAQIEEEPDLDDIVQQILQCECNALTVDKHLIKCEICAKYQHYPCYGYLDSRPPTHVCYSCLFVSEPFREDRLLEMQTLCIARRALFYLRENNPLTSIESLSEYLGCDKVSTNRVLAELKKNGYIKDAPGRKKNGKNKQGEPICSFGGLDLENYFNPEKGIYDLLVFTNESLLGGTTQLKNGEETSLQGPPTNNALDSTPLPFSVDKEASGRTFGSDDSSTEDYASSHTGSSLGQAAETPLPRRSPSGIEKPQTANHDGFGNKRKVATVVVPPSKKLKVWNLGTVSPLLLERSSGN